ncbi:MAG: hypothetical protein ACI97A_004033 [Planctomycetota bacterium]|jgi:hypothetical protein
MSRFSWSSGALNEQSLDLQQSGPTDPLRPALPTTAKFGDPWVTSPHPQEPVSELLRTWGQERQEHVLNHIELDIWSGLSQKIRNSMP